MVHPDRPPAAERSTIHLLVNPASRRGAADADAVHDRLSGYGHRVERIEPDGPDDVAPAIERTGPDRVVAVGGDGLIHHALPALVGTDTVLGLVPSGTGNDFARALGLPRRRSAATDRTRGPATAVDVLGVEHGDGSHSLVATALTAGFSGRVNETANARDFPRGQLKYTVASLTELRRLEAFDLGVQMGESDTIVGTESCSFFAAANTRFFGGGMAIAPEADAVDGRLHLTIVGEVPAWQLAAVLPTVFVGQHVRHPSVRVLSADKIGLCHDQQLWADGELIGSGSVTVAVVPKALFVAAL